ncbi:hypothetical protein P154DRAFT_581299 [Amniculicola lignicola CBS 123094]|uniref:Uncharacterized protein n=1 Tax=Amniculicola lignicola CBS 123094 TaxID=1392246 RepID=A0A6A5VZM2_9PLEO|nr:hypothetical protein P154DRAFT_581299 [Amniculicola lignicola CBS 123094]
MSPSIMASRACIKPILAAAGVAIGVYTVFKVVRDFKAVSSARQGRKPVKWPSLSSIATGTYQRVRHRQVLRLTWYGYGQAVVRDFANTVVMVDVKEHNVSVVEYLDGVWYLQMPQELGTIWSIGTGVPRRVSSCENAESKLLLTTAVVRRMVVDLLKTSTPRNHLLRITANPAQLLLPWYGCGTDAVCDPIPVAANPVLLEHTIETMKYLQQRFYNKHPRDLLCFLPIYPSVGKPMKVWMIIYPSYAIWKYGLLSIFTTSTEAFVDPLEQKVKSSSRMDFKYTIEMPVNKAGLPQSLPRRIKFKAVPEYEKCQGKIGFIDAGIFRKLTIRTLQQCTTLSASRLSQPNPPDWPHISEMEDAERQLRYIKPEHPLEMDEFKRRCDCHVTKHGTVPDYAAIQTAMKKGEEQGRSWFMKRLKNTMTTLAKKNWDITDLCDIDPYAPPVYEDYAPAIYTPPATGMTDVDEYGFGPTLEEEEQELAEVLAVALRCTLKQDKSMTKAGLKAHLQFLVHQIEWDYVKVAEPPLTVARASSRYKAVQIAGPVIDKAGAQRLIVQAMNCWGRMCAALVKKYSIVIDVVEMWWKYPGLIEIFAFATGTIRPTYEAKPGSTQTLRILPPAVFPDDGLPPPSKNRNMFNLGFRIDELPPVDEDSPIHEFMRQNPFKPEKTTRFGNKTLAGSQRHIFCKASFRELIIGVTKGHVKKYERGTGAPWPPIDELLSQLFGRDRDIEDYIPLGAPKGCNLDYSPFIHGWMKKLYTEYMNNHKIVPALEKVFGDAERLYHEYAEELVEKIKFHNWKLWEIDGVYDEEHRPTGDQDSQATDVSHDSYDSSNSWDSDEKRLKEVYDPRYDSYAKILYSEVRGAGRKMSKQHLLITMMELATFIFGIAPSNPRGTQSSTPPTSEGSNSENDNKKKIKSQPVPKRVPISELLRRHPLPKPDQQKSGLWLDNGDDVVSRDRNSNPFVPLVSAPAVEHQVQSLLSPFGPTIPYPYAPRGPDSRSLGVHTREQMLKAKAWEQYTERQVRLGYNGARRATADAKRPPPTTILRALPTEYVRRERQLVAQQNLAAGYTNGEHYLTIFDEFGRLCDAAGQPRIPWIAEAALIHEDACEVRNPNPFIDMEAELNEEQLREAGEAPMTPINKFFSDHEAERLWANLPVPAVHQPQLVVPAWEDQQGNLCDRHGSPIHVQQSSEEVHRVVKEFFAPQTHGVRGLGHVDIPADMYCRPVRTPTQETIQTANFKNSYQGRVFGSSPVRPCPEQRQICREWANRRGWW